ncbi:glutaredoxin family protein [Oceanobacillus damuensis]|uniref:glutaredoxin family protein n=1 Tax=Oceanobacillus damuensis TaxID=937928 RepID=UPI0008336B82|nr:glutaredoxin domain-containing protein [Oceanobacillus damuensis]
MNNSQVIIYVSDHSKEADKVIRLLKDNGISYITRNVTENDRYMKELQSKEIYGTPATFIDDQEVILGYQRNKIKYALGLDDNASHYSSLFDGFSK